MNRHYSLLRRVLAGLLAAAAVCPPAAALTVLNNISPHNGERPRRSVTGFIILHTTEGPERGSLEKVRANGECHYFITGAGAVYRIVESGRVAYHTGRSMWAGRSDIDTCSIGIECAGFYYRPLTAAQIAALRDLVAALQQAYGVPDERVMPHSMVAYGAPNRWHPRSHRGRKRCGMLFADPALRAKLGLTARPAYDPDVKAGRLVAADPYLAARLFPRPGATVVATEPVAATPDRPEAGPDNEITPCRSAWDIARDQYRSPLTTYVFPDGRKFRGNDITDWSGMPIGTRVLVGEGERENAEDGIRTLARGGSARELAGDEAALGTTFYLTPDGRTRRGNEIAAAEMQSLPAGTRVLVGYVAGGSITAKRSAFDICGGAWNAPSTVYRFPDGTVTTGDAVKQTAIPRNAQVFFRK